MGVGILPGRLSQEVKTQWRGAGRVGAERAWGGRVLLLASPETPGEEEAPEGGPGARQPRPVETLLWPRF